MNKNYSLLLIGVILSATSSIFIKCVDAHAFTISFYRVFFAGVFWLFVVLFKDRKKILSIEKKNLGLSFLSGLFLALYYSVWITSLEYTTIANASVLGALCPVFVAFVSWLLFREKLKLRCLAGIAICVAGSGLLVASKIKFGITGIRGDLLAVLGAFFISGYYMIGGHLRPFMTLKVYVTLVYLSAALVLFIMIKTAGIKLTGYSFSDTAIMISHGFVCSVLGHGIYNFLLEKLPPVTLALSALIEPVFAIIFAVILFNEILNPITMAGIVTIMGGLLVYSLPGGKADLVKR